MKLLKFFYRIFIGYLSYYANYSQIRNANLIYFSEKANWAIRFVGEELKESINKINIGYNFFITSKPIPVKNKICHFGSQYMWVQMQNIYKNKNKIIVSFLHGNYAYDDKIDEHINEFLLSIKYVDKIVDRKSVV